jgi:hypothetical protein
MSLSWRSLQRRSLEASRLTLEWARAYRPQVSMRSTSTIPSSHIGLDSRSRLAPRLRRGFAAVGAALWVGSSVVASSAALGALGCTPRQAPPALATGERPVTGVPRFDRVFGDINAALVAVQEGRSEEAEARNAVARRVGLQEGVSFDVLGARLRERTARLAEDGLTLQLEFSGIDDADSHEGADEGPAVDGAPGGGPEALGEAPAGPTESDAGDASGSPPSATLRTPGREPQPRELRLLEALAQAALSGATVYTSMSHVRHRVERLAVEVTALGSQVDTAFTDVDSRERARVKLEEARTFLPQLGAQAREVAGSADTLISLLDEAANTVPVVPAKKRPPSAPLPARPATPATQPQVLPSGRPAAPATPAATAPAPSLPAPTPAPSPP